MNLHFPENGWEKITRNRSAWWVGELERALIVMEGLRGVQWVPGDRQPQAECWLGYIHGIRQAGKLCQVYLNTQGALTILKECEGKGLLLVIDESLSSAGGQALLKALRSW